MSRMSHISQLLIIMSVLLFILILSHAPSAAGGLDYEQFFQRKIQDKKDDSTYRNFRVLARNAGHFPTAKHFNDPLVPIEDGSDITVWCSNDYMGMSKHPQVLNATM